MQFAHINRLKWSFRGVKTQSTDARDNRWRKMQNLRKRKKRTQWTKDGVYRATGSTQLNRLDALGSSLELLWNDMEKNPWRNSLKSTLKVLPREYKKVSVEKGGWFGVWSGVWESNSPTLGNVLQFNRP